MMPLLLVSFLLLSSLNMTWLPFVFITEVSPESPMIFDMVTVTWRVQTDVSVPITVAQWDFGDGTGGVDTQQNMTGTFYITRAHVYVVPGDYYLRVGVVDALNRTAQDVIAVTVQPRATVITFNVNPVNVNSSYDEHFTFEASLATDQGVTLVGESVAFWYSPVPVNQSADGIMWYSAGGGLTGNGGRIMTLWVAPFDGQYIFKATFDGGELYAPTETIYAIICQVTPEFAMPSVVLIIGFLSIILCKRIGHRPSTSIHL